MTSQEISRGSVRFSFSILFSKIKKNKKGFTLIEILTVLGITSILVVAALPMYGNLQVSTQLNEDSSIIVQVLRTARARSIARLNNSSHGVYIEINAGSDDRYILYQGASYALRDETYDRAIVLNDSLSLSTTLNAAEINFTKGLGMPNTTGSITLTHDVTGSRVLNINSFGIVDEE